MLPLSFINHVRKKSIFNGTCSRKQKGTSYIDEVKNILFKHILLKIISISLCLRLHWVSYDNIKQLISILNFELFPSKVKVFVVKWFLYFNLHVAFVRAYFPSFHSTNYIIYVLDLYLLYDLWFMIHTIRSRFIIFIWNNFPF